MEGVITTEPVKSLTPERIADYIAKDGANAARFEWLRRYYLGKHDILNVTKAEHKPNNKLVNNFCSNIVNTTVGYYLGQPITYNCTDAELLEEVSVINRYNDEALHNTGLAKDLSIYGVAVELLYVDEDTEIRYTRLDPTEIIPVYSNGVDQSLAAVIRHYYATEQDRVDHIETVEVYDAVTMRRYKGAAAPVLQSEEPHYFGDVPVNIYRNNEHGTGDFEGVITLIDAYNTMQSESVNDYQVLADAYLAISGMDVDDKEVEKLRDNKLLMMDEGGQAQWLVKNVNDVWIENIKNRLAKDIFTFSNTVDMTDENFAANLSGIAIKYKLMGMENRVAITERYFTKSLMRRYELICNILYALGSNHDYTLIEPLFTRNIPVNNVETATMINTLRGIVSTETLMQQLSFVTDLEAEKTRLEEEQSINSLLGFGGDDDAEEE